MHIHIYIDTYTYIYIYLQMSPRKPRAACENVKSDYICMAWATSQVDQKRGIYFRISWTFDLDRQSVGLTTNTLKATL